MTVGELIKKLNKRDKNNIVYYRDIHGYHEITDVEPCITGNNESVTLIMNGDGGRHTQKDYEKGLQQLIEIMFDKEKSEQFLKKCEAIGIEPQTDCSWK